MKQFFLKNKKIVIVAIFVLLLCSLVVFGYFVMKDKILKNNNKSTEQKEQTNSNITEKEMTFEQLKNFQQEMQTKYGSEFTKIRNFTQKHNYFEYETTQSTKKPHSLLVLQKDYSISNKIHEPYCIFLPDTNKDYLINGNKYFDLKIEELKEYCCNNKKTMYIIKITDLNCEEQSIISSETSQSNTQKKFPPIQTIILEKLDDIWENQTFKQIENQIPIKSFFARLSSQSSNILSLQELDTVLYVGEDQENTIPKDGEYKMFIFVKISDEEKTNKKWKEIDINPNKIFNKKYKELTLEDIKNNNNREIIIFKIKYADYNDKTHNPCSEQKLE